MAGSDKSDLVCVGAFAGAHGVRGQVRIKSFTADAEAVASYGPLLGEGGSPQYRIKLTGKPNAKGLLMAVVEGVTDRDVAHALKGKRLYVPRAALPEPDEDEFYFTDLIGLEARMSDGTTLGRIKAVLDFGAGDVIEVQKPDGSVVMLPFSKSAVPEVKVSEGYVVIEPLPGMLDPAGSSDEDGKDGDRE